MAATSSFWALWLMAWLALSGCLVHASSHGHQHVPVRLSATRNVIRTDANVTVASENSTIASPASSPGATGKGPLLAAANDTAIAAARKIVADAIAQASIRNAARIQNPARNHYSLKPGTVVGDRTVTKRDGNSAGANAALAPPLLPITDEIAAAAALVAEADAAADNTGPPASLLKRGSSSYWMDNLKHLGTSPWGKNSSYKVYRNVVTDYGAVGDGKTDDTKAIWNAIYDGNRCAAGCNGATTTNAVVFFPGGTYLVSTNITVLFGTQIIGDPTNIPTIKAASSFVGLGVLSTDVYVGDGAGADGKDNEWYINTASFYRSIRNLNIDISAAHPNMNMTAIHYQVAQATSLHNVNITATATSPNAQMGMFAENGSGGFISDVTFNGGNWGFFGGNQQFTVHRLTFTGCKTAIQIIWDWGWLWKDIKITNCDVGFMYVPNDRIGAPDGAGTIMDSTFLGVGQAIVVAPPSNKPNSGTTGLVLSNIVFRGVQAGVVDTSGNQILSGSANVPYWVLGATYDGSDNRTWTQGADFALMGDADLAESNWTPPSANAPPNTPYFARARPEYEHVTASGVVQAKSAGAKGDGVTDDTAALNALFNTNSDGGSMVYIDAGVYMISDTVVIPVGTRIFGEGWAQLCAYGSKFQNASNPHVMLKVGNEGDVGSVEIQGLLFTTQGSTPGAVLVEWNMLADIGSQGSAAMWDSHARLGGATGTKLTPAECPVGNTPSPTCMTASLVMHLTANASAYLENVWLWTADHMIDDPDLISDKNPMTMISVYTARGMLIESTSATWLWATASEHAIFYQFNFNSASSVFGGLLQTESPYFQPKPAPPAPYASAVGVYESDPSYAECNTTSGSTDPTSGCDASWAIIINDSEEIHVAAAGVYSWFSDYSQQCINSHQCQMALVSVSSNADSVRLENLITIGANVSVVDDDGIMPALDNVAVSNNNASWSQISLYLAPTDGGDGPEGSDGIALCDYSDEYDTLDDLINDLPNIPAVCGPGYALPVLGSLLSQAVDNFTNTGNGYSSAFDGYVEYINDMIQPQLDACMNWTEANATPGPCNQYFSCVYNNYDHTSASTTCPPPGKDFFSDPDWQTTYTLVDPNGFWNELATNYGIEQDWVQFSTYNTTISCLSWTGPIGSCDPPLKIQSGYPVKASKIVVPDPRSFFTNQSTIDYLANLRVTIDSTALMIASGDWIGLYTDIVTSLVLPVSMAVQASQSMADVVAIGNAQHAADKKNLILTILGAVFMIVPFLGDGLGAAASDVISSIGKIIAVIGGAGNAGLSLYDIIQNKDSAPMAIIGILGGIAGAAGAFGRDPADMAEMASLRRGMSSDDVAALGDVFKENDDKIQQIISQVCKA